MILKLKRQILQISTELDKIITSILEKHPIDIFIHSPAYPAQHKPVMKTTWNDFQKQFDLQTKSFFQISKSLIPHMKSKKFWQNNIYFDFLCSWKTSEWFSRLCSWKIFVIGTDKVYGGRIRFIWY